MLCCSVLHSISGPLVYGTAVRERRQGAVVTGGGPSGVLRPLADASESANQGLRLSVTLHKIIIMRVFQFVRQSIMSLIIIIMLIKFSEVFQCALLVFMLANSRNFGTCFGEL